MVDINVGQIDVTNNNHKNLTNLVQAMEMQSVEHEKLFQKQHVTYTDLKCGHYNTSDHIQQLRT